MKVEDAIELVIELAKQSVLSEKDCDNDEILLTGRTNQIEAISTIEDFFTNVVFSDD